MKGQLAQLALLGGDTAANLVARLVDLPTLRTPPSRYLDERHSALYQSPLELVESGGIA